MASGARSAKAGAKPQTATKPAAKAAPAAVKAAPAGSKAKGEPASARRGWSRIVLPIVLLAAVPLLHSVVVLAAAMLPTVAAWFVDRSEGKGLTLTVAPLNACGALLFLTELWRRGPDFTSLGHVLADPFGWLVTLGAAGVGWAIFLGTPKIVARLAAVQTQTRSADLRRQQKRLVEQWGEEVAS
jgi:hypothetical protein